MRCLTFGMPLMGCSSPDEREAVLRCLATQLDSIPLQSASESRPSFLPLPTVHHVLCSRDLLARATLCSSPVRQRLRQVLQAAREATRSTHRLSSALSPYGNALTSGHASAAAGGGGSEGEGGVRKGVDEAELSKVRQNVSDELREVCRVLPLPRSRLLRCLPVSCLVPSFPLCPRSGVVLRPNEGA